MRVYSYIVAKDGGFAPNPFHGFCTLACCKPKIRATAQPGDLIVGLTSRGEGVTYAMKVSAVLGFADYWRGERYEVKRPIFKSPTKLRRMGDNIYEPDGSGGFRQLPSAHSQRAGSEHSGNKEHDLDGFNVLVGDRFVYFGVEAPALPGALAFLRVGRGHKCQFTDDHVAEVNGWFEELPQGVQGRPRMWSASDAASGIYLPGSSLAKGVQRSGITRTRAAGLGRMIGFAFRASRVARSSYSTRRSTPKPSLGLLRSCSANAKTPRHEAISLVIQMLD